jgi:small subunit ribosomal protein S17
MADEEKQDQVEETQDEATASEDAEAPEAADDAATEAPAEEEAPVDEEAPADEEAPVEEEETPPEEAPAAAAPSGDDEEADKPTPKQLRKRARSRHKGEARPARSPEERAAERGEARRRNAAGRRRYRVGQRQRGGEAGTGTPPAERVPGPKKVRLGKVVSTKADKTITVRIEVVRRHPTYEKVVRRSATLHAHDAENEANEGDTVRVVETRPLSKTKRWRLLEVIERAR